MRPRSSNAIATGCRTVGSAATTTARNPSGRDIFDNVSSAAGCGGDGTGLGCNLANSALVSIRFTSGSGSSASIFMPNDTQATTATTIAGLMRGTRYDVPTPYAI